MLKIYKISQNANDGYDTYDSAIVVAEDEEQAKKIHPNGYMIIFDGDGTSSPFNGSWANNISEIKTEYIGMADKKFNVPQVICASFHAG